MSLHQTWGSLLEQGVLVSETQGCTHLRLSSPEITNVHHHAQLLYESFRDRTHFLLIASKHSAKSAHLKTQLLPHSNMLTDLISAAGLEAAAENHTCGPLRIQTLQISKTCFCQCGSVRLPSSTGETAGGGL